MTMAISPVRSLLAAAIIVVGSSACGAKGPNSEQQFPSAETEPEPNIIDQANALMGRGGMALSEEDYQTALDYYLEAAALLDSQAAFTVEQAEAHFQAAEMALAVRDKDLALKHYERSAEIDLKFSGKSRTRAAIALTNAGVIYKEKQDADKARNCWERALKIYEEAPPEQRNTANIQMIQQNIRDLEAGY